MEKILVGQAYLHFSGKVITVQAISKDFKDSTKINVIYRQLDDGELYNIPMSDFFVPHPKTGIPRYRLIRPQNIQIK